MKKKVPAARPGTPLKASVKLNSEHQTLFDKVAEEVVHGDRDLFDSLSDHERRLVIDWLSLAIVDGEDDNFVSQVLWEVDFIRKPVSIEQFLEDEYYFGKKTKGLHENWKRDLCSVFSPKSRVAEWLMTGAIGIGKTTVAVAGLGYKAYYISCLKNPARYYGLLPDELVYFGIYSITKKQVSDSGYYKLRTLFDSSPYFRQDFPRNTKIDSQIDFKNSPLKVITGSQSMHALGLDMFSFMMDEVNFMKAKENEDTAEMTGQAYEIYNATTSRLLSRFSRPGGTLPGIAMLLSSRNAQTSFLEERIKKAREKEEIGDTVWLSDYALWECKAKHRFISIWDPNAKVDEPAFNVEVGDRTARSKILRPGEQPRKGARAVLIPGELRSKFEEDVDQALRDLAGVATFNMNPLVSDRQSIYDAVRPALFHPFKSEEVVLDVRDDFFIEDVFLLDKVCRIKDSKWVPMLNHGCPRFLHVDLAISGDCAGIAMCHMSGVKEILRRNDDGTESRAESPFILYDFMLRIRPPRGSHIDLAKIRSFIFYLRKFYNIEAITFDGYQSEDSVQILTKQRLLVKLLSVDREDTQYISLRAAHYERRVGMYHYDPYIDEVLDLQRDVKKMKVDHPLKNSKGGKGSKDVADAACGAMWNCLQSKTALKAAPPIIDDGTPRLSNRIIDPSDPTPRKVLPTPGKVPLPSQPSPPPPRFDNPQKRRINGMPLAWESFRDNLDPNR